MRQNFLIGYKQQRRKFRDYIAQTISLMTAYFLKLQQHLQRLPTEDVLEN